MSLQHFGKGALRMAKNYTKGYSDTQAKVRDATSNDPWGPSGTQLSELAQLSYNQNDFVEIMEMLDKRLNDKGKNWRHVFKSLTVLDYLLHGGSENVVLYFKDNIYVIKTLKEFQYTDEEGKDCGANVRQKAKDITNLLLDPSRLREERRNRANMRDRLLRGDEYAADDENISRRPQREDPPPQAATDDDLRRAIEKSKESFQEEQARSTEDHDLETAIRLSKEEEERRGKTAEEANTVNLLGDEPIQPPETHLQPQPQLAVQPQLTMQPLYMPPQLTMQPQFTAQPLFTQFTSFNPYQQLAQQEAMQAEYVRQQQEWLRRQQELQAQPQLQWLQPQPQQQPQQQLQQPQSVIAHPTGFGSNNPFAPSTSPASSTPPVTATNGAGPAFNLQGTYEGSPGLRTGSASMSGSSDDHRVPSSSRSEPDGVKPTFQARMDEKHSQLAGLFASRDDDGVDTFGNVGLARFGETEAGRRAKQVATVTGQRTGAQPMWGRPTGTSGNHNPFAKANDQPFFSV